MVGLALRWVTWRAYRPALLFFDSLYYLTGALTGALDVRRPSGYSFALIPFARSGDLAIVSFGQHVLGMAVAVVMYVFLLRRRVPAWGAALATLPLLCDPLQLILEQYVLADVLFEALLILACVLLLWRRRPLLIDVVAAGALLGYAAIVRGAGTGLVIPAAVAVVALRVGWRRVVALVVAFVVPVLLYMTAFHQQQGVWATSTYTPWYIYGRVASFVNCQGLQLPPYQQRLCPQLPVDQRLSSNWYIWNEQAPPATLNPPPGVTVGQALRDFDKRVIRDQPMAFARIVGRDFMFGFHPSRLHEVAGFPASRWLFGVPYPFEMPTLKAEHFTQLGLWPPSLDRGYARFLTAFQNYFHTPGPLLFVAAVIGVVASAGVGRARWSGDRVACGLLVAVCITSVVTSAALAGFSWRYQLPQLGLLGPAAALGLTASIRRSIPTPDAEPTTLRRLTATVLRRRQPDDALRQAEPWVGIATAGLAGMCVGAAAAASGWAAPATAGVLALVAAAATAVLLFTSRWRRMRTS